MCDLSLHALKTETRGSLKDEKGKDDEQSRRYRTITNARRNLRREFTSSQCYARFLPWKRFESRVCLVSGTTVTVSAFASEHARASPRGTSEPRESRIELNGQCGITCKAGLMLTYDDGEVGVEVQHERRCFSLGSGRWGFLGRFGRMLIK